MDRRMRTRIRIFIARVCQRRFVIFRQLFIFYWQPEYFARNGSLLHAGAATATAAAECNVGAVDLPPCISLVCG